MTSVISAKILHYPGIICRFSFPVAAGKKNFIKRKTYTARVRLHGSAWARETAHATYLHTIRIAICDYSSRDSCIHVPHFTGLIEEVSLYFRDGIPFYGIWPALEKV